MDTPRHADIKMREAAGKEITEALKQDGLFQIFFVVTLSAGRFRPEDIGTIWLVLRNAPDITSFSIIINKLSQKEYDFLQKNNEKLKLFPPLELISGGHKFSILLLLHNQMLEDANDMIAKYPELDKFVDDAPWIQVDPSNVNDIPGDEESFKEQMDSISNKADNFTANQVPLVKFV